MRRAFVKDDDDLPELRAQVERTEPYLITALGRAKLESAHRDASDPAERARLEHALELARALLGGRAAERALWNRPVGDLTLRIRTVDYPGGAGQNAFAQREQVAWRLNKSQRCLS
jgi:hypothetical protein